MALSCCTARSKSSSKTVVDDSHHHVYPVHALDQSTESQPLLTWVMCFNDVLHAQKLQTSLCQLLEIGDWKKLACRLRVTDDGTLEAYAPKVFSDEEPACAFFHGEHFESTIQCHPVGRHFSFPARRAFTQIYPPEQPSALFHPDFPSRVQDLIDRRLPQLVLQVLSFCDATVVTISWPENLVDDVSLRVLLDNWSLVLTGRKHAVANILGSERDVLEETVTQAEEKGPLMKTSHPARMTWSQWLVPEWWKAWRQPRLQRRMVFIPELIYDEFLSEVRAELSDMVSIEGDFQAKVSDADIAFAWVSKMQGQGQLQPRTVINRRAVDLRRRIPGLRSRSGHFLQNLTLSAHSQLSPHDLNDSVGKIALKQKRCMDEQSSEEQWLALAKTAMEKNAPQVCAAVMTGGDPAACTLDFCDLTLQRIFSAADFSSAVVRQGDFTRPRFNVPGTMISAYSLRMDLPPTEPACKVIGIDTDGNFWMCCQLEASVWVRMEEELYRLQKSINSPISGNSMRYYSASRR